MKKAARVLLTILLAVVGIATLVSTAGSLIFQAPFLSSLVFLLIMGGIAILALAAVTGAGFAEYGYYGASLMFVSSHYAKTITADRPRRRAEQSDAMIVGTVIGLGLVGVGLLLAYLPWLVPLVVVAMALVIHRLGRETFPSRSV